MNATLKLEPVEDLPRSTASDVKKLGWRGVMKVLGREGTMVVTNHNEPEAVILSVADYAALVRVIDDINARPDDALESLRRRFDERLAVLQQPDASDRLRQVMRNPASLHGKVKAGDSH